MNRKLLNGLLVLAFAAGGVGTFTSCKDENFGNDVLVDVESLEAKLEAIRNVSDATFKANLDKWLNDKTNGFNSYEDMVAAVNTMYDLYTVLTDPNLSEIPSELQPFVNLLYDLIYNDAVNDANAYTDAEIAKLKALLEQMSFAQENRPSSISVNGVYNPVFGTINLPVGINSTVLATYLYAGTDADFSFPVDAHNHLSPFSPYTPDAQFATALDELAGSVSVDLVDGSFTDADGVFGNMGGAVLALNPTNINFLNGNYTVELVKTSGESVFSTADEDGCLALTEWNGDELMFGYTRDGEGSDLYALQVNATAENAEALKFDVDKSELKDALKQAYANKSLSNIAHLGETLFKAVNNKLPAYAVKVSWEDNEMDLMTGEVTGTTPNSIYSDFNLAATILHPLSYNSQISAVVPPGKKVPVFHNPLKEYLQNLNNKLHFEFDEIAGVDYVMPPFDLEVTLTNNGRVMFQYYDAKTGQYLTSYATYDQSGITASQASLQQFVNAILEAAGYQLAGEVNKQIVDELNASIADINAQLKDLEGQLGDLNAYLEDIENSKKLTYAQKLVDVYNKLAEKANNFLSDPEHYLQVMMAYSGGNGVHHMSNDIYYPIVYNTAKYPGDAIELIVSSYNGEVLVPSYKKYVAITGVVYPGGVVSTEGLAELNAAVGLNQVYPGTQQRIVLGNVDALKGQKVRLTYVSVDYRGMCSMENYYLLVE